MQSEAPSDPRPRDDNLHLVLSSEQEQWIRDKLSMAVGLAWASVFFLALSVGWLSALSVGWVSFDNGGPGCFELSADAPDYQARLREFRAVGLEPCPPEGAQSEGAQAGYVVLAVSILAVLALVISPLTLGRNLFLVRQYRGYLKDHASFLRRYNRG
tara:strand:+ start:86 stop:556 length:471 start_codon:yes stop_codon:yes gene_type:complete